MVRWMAFALIACGGEELGTAEACDLAKDWLDDNDLLTPDGLERVESFGCSAFLSRLDEGTASIDVNVTWDDGDESGRATCALIEFDQGWEVSACSVL